MARATVMISRVAIPAADNRKVQTMTVKESLDQMIQTRASEIAQQMIAEMLGQSVEQPKAARKAAPVATAERDETPTVRRAKRQPGRASRVYVTTGKMDRSKARKVESTLFPTAAIAWRAIVDAKKPISAAEIEAKTDLKKKTVESVLFFLRQSGHVKSQPIAR